MTEPRWTEVPPTLSKRRCERAKAAIEPASATRPRASHGQSRCVTALNASAKVVLATRPSEVTPHTATTPDKTTHHGRRLELATSGAPPFRILHGPTCDGREGTPTGPSSYSGVLPGVD